MGTKTVTQKTIRAICPNEKQHRIDRLAPSKDAEAEYMLESPIKDDRPNNFYTDCGAKLIQKTASYKLVVCDKCETPIFKDLDNFCPQCGSNVASPE